MLTRDKATLWPTKQYGAYGELPGALGRPRHRRSSHRLKSSADNRRVVSRVVSQRISSRLTLTEVTIR
jgi:hypothetical protein